MGGKRPERRRTDDLADAEARGAGGAIQGGPTGVAVGAGAIWATATEQNAVARIDPTTSRLSWIRVGAGPTGVSATKRAVWVANSRAGTVSRIDTGQGKLVATVEVKERPYRIAADGRSVWVTFLGPPPGEHH